MRPLKTKGSLTISSNRTKPIQAIAARLYLFILGNVALFSTFAQDSIFKFVRTPQAVTVNRTLPGGILSYGEAMPAYFSQHATDKEIYGVHFFEEPLIPTNGAYESTENDSLVVALANFSQRKNPDDFSMFANFFAEFPNSRWRGALLADLGLVYRRTGYYSLALDSWKKSWDLLKNITDRNIKLLADRVVSELLLMDAWVGRKEEINNLITDLGNRTFEGAATEKIASVREGLWLMNNNPGISFMCGPSALNKLFMQKSGSNKPSQILQDVQSTAKGFSMTDLKALAGQIGLHYKIAYRSVGAAVIPNSIVHWKLDHYSALFSEENGSFKCEDATVGSLYGQQFWLSEPALDSSASGYFLVPDTLLPAGWRPVSDMEGNLVFGKGQVPSDDKGKNTKPCDPNTGCSDCSEPAMAQCNVHTVPVSLHVYDRPLRYTPPVGPSMDWRMDYNQRDIYQPASFPYSNFGPKWTFQWLSYVADNVSSPNANSDVYMMGGGVETFTSYNSSTKTYATEVRSGDILVRVCANCYELRHTDGSKAIFERPDGSTSGTRKIFLTRLQDKAGNEMKVMYDANLRVVALQDAIGQVTTVSYELASDIYKVTKVTDPFGRSTKFEYTSGYLTKITDMIGIVSSFHYISGSDFMDQMITPYGTTSFIKQDGPGTFRSLEIRYPQGEKERVEFAEGAKNIPFTETIFPNTSVMPLFNSNLYYRNTFFWDKKAMQDGPGDYTKAKIFHWLHGSDAVGENGATSPLLESVKMPLENREWYDYQGQYNAGFTNAGMSAKPSIIGRVLDDGTSQFIKNTYNSVSKLTSSIDPLNRKMTYIYDTTNINLTEVRQTTGTKNELLAQYTYNNQHLPLTFRDASGTVTSYTYNTKGQLTSTTNARKETTTLGYDANGYLNSIIGPTGAKMVMAYDGFGRVRTVTDQEGYAVTTDYDNMDRPTVITYPDSSFEQIVYDRLDPIKTRDRIGRWSSTTYDSLDRVASIIDPLGRTTKFVWCSCGSLSQIIDPLNRSTSFTRDIQGRVTIKTYPDGKKESYAFENTTSRMLSATDALGQKTSYNYYPDNNVKQIRYTNALIATGSVSFTYDSSYNRISSMTDTTGRTAYAYYPVQATPVLGGAKLASVDGPLANDLIQYSYDTLGRIAGRSINNVSAAVQYDAMGRIVSETNVLGKFDYNYVDQTQRLAAVNIPNGQTTVFDYFNNTGDHRLKEIWNKTKAGNTLSKFDYGYNAEGQITNWIQQSSGSQIKNYLIGYDAADQLVSVMQKATDLPVSILKYAYDYDSAGNCLYENANNAVTTAVFNNLNQLTKRWKVDTARQQGALPISFGTNNVDNNIFYDANGNTTSVSNTGTVYAWDAVNRLVKIIRGGNITEFVYDGLSRRVAEKLNGTIIKRWLWDGAALVEERDATGGNVTKRFFTGGEQINGTANYFTIDHLGSIREMTDSIGSIVAKYDYDFYGNRIKIFGIKEADFGFAGLYYHIPTGLYLSLYRVYDPALKRWLNRDPIAESGGLNLYSYVGNNSINLTDRFGLYALVLTGGLELGSTIIAGGTIATGGAIILAGGIVFVGWEAWKLYNKEHADDPDKDGSKDKENSCPVPPAAADLPWKPGESPGKDYEWKGNGPPESGRGNWVNDKTGIKIHPDLNHPPPKGPHYGVTLPDGTTIDIFPPK